MYARNSNFAKNMNQDKVQLPSFRIVKLSKICNAIDRTSIALRTLLSCINDNVNERKVLSINPKEYNQNKYVNLNYKMKIEATASPSAGSRIWNGQ